MKRIKLTQGKYAFVDDEDFKRISQYKWYAYKNKSGIWYARGRINKQLISMHRFILGLQKGDGKIVDHINNDGLNNQKSNLRLCSARENRINARKRRNICSSKYLGVSYYAGDSVISDENLEIKWVANIMINGKQKFLGYFNIEEQAALAYDLAAKEYFGEFARLNFF